LAEAIRRSLADVSVQGAADMPPSPPPPVWHPPPSAPPAPPPDDEDDGALCVVCLSEPRTAGLLHGDSMHVVACAGCAERLGGRPCPICRAHVERVVPNIYR
jgi:hypothetical protein